MQTTLFIFGPSCAGKSTLSLQLQNTLDGDWTYLDRDDLVENQICEEEDADSTIDHTIQSAQTNLIIDAQTPWRKKQKGEYYFMVLPPLEVLLERDRLRSELYQRPEKRTMRARKFVEKTHSILSRLDRKDFHLCFDPSQLSLEQEVAMIISIAGLSKKIQGSYTPEELNGDLIGSYIMPMFREDTQNIENFLVAKKLTKLIRTYLNC